MQETRGGPSSSSESVGFLLRKLYAAFESKQRRVVEELLAEDFTFTSPRDERIGKAEYMKRCWPNAERIARFEIEKLFVRGDEAFVRYRAQRAGDGIWFQNTEYFRFEGGKVREVEVYFGRDLGPGSAAW